MSKRGHAQLAGDTDGGMCTDQRWQPHHHHHPRGQPHAHDGKPVTDPCSSTTGYGGGVRRPAAAAAVNGAKRRAGTQAHPAPSMASAPEVCRYLERLLRSFEGASLHNPPYAPDLLGNAELWQCFAELNLVLERNWATLVASEIVSLHCFTRTGKMALWSRFAAASGLPQDAVARGPPPGSPSAQLVAFVLDNVFAAYPDASIHKYSIRLPPWLVGWATRWGWGQRPVEVLVLQAYPRCADPSSSTSACQPVRQLYVPVC